MTRPLTITRWAHSPHQHRGIMTIKQTPQIQPIPTTYRGVRFRSRLEARWAVFYDALGLEWHYEHEGYQLPSGWYVPDFWLPTVNALVEIKPAAPEERAIKLCHELSAGVHSGARPRVLLFSGEVKPPPWEEYDMPAYLFDGAWMDTDYQWCECLKCGRIGLEYQGRSSRICREKCGPWPDDRGHNAHSPRLLAAYEKARTTRFW